MEAEPLTAAELTRTLKYRMRSPEYMNYVPLFPHEAKALVEIIADLEVKLAALVEELRKPTPITFNEITTGGVIPDRGGGCECYPKTAEEARLTGNTQRQSVAARSVPHSEPLTAFASNPLPVRSSMLWRRGLITIVRKGRISVRMPRSQLWRRLL